jgi:hypothetical protein
VKTLEYIKLPYQSPGVDSDSLRILATMPNLCALYLGNPEICFKLNNLTNSKMQMLKDLLRNMKQNGHISKLRSISLYECDIKLLKMLSEIANESLERLSIVKWWQPKDKFNTAHDKVLKTEDLK